MNLPASEDPLPPLDAKLDAFKIKAFAFGNGNGWHGKELMTPPDNDLNTAGSSLFEEEIQKDRIESQGIY